MSREGMLDGVRQLYEESLDRHGAVSAGVGWPDPDAHRVRFDKLTQLIDTVEEISVNDLGCGYGAYFGYLRQRGMRVGRFRGYDISSEMITKARAFEPTGEFYLGSQIIEKADYSFACGIFNVRLGHDEAKWKEHILSTIDNMAEMSRRGFAFNLLTSYVDFRRDHLYYGDPREFFDICKTKYSRKVTLLHDYPLYEWTMLVRT
jgi:SAM-dependent methyltransferase